MFESGLGGQRAGTVGQVRHTAIRGVSVMGQIASEVLIERLADWGLTRSSARAAGGRLCTWPNC